MSRWIFDLFLVAVAIVVACVIPRSYSEELRWTVAWEHRAFLSDAVAPQRDESDPALNTVRIVLDDRFLVLATEDGSIVHTGRRADYFTASDSHFINQSPGAQRWAVQRWDGGETQFVDAIGTPQITGEWLVQTTETGEASLTFLGEGDPVEHRLDALDETVDIAVCSACPEPYVARGSLYGTVELISLDGSVRATFENQTPPFSETVPSIYGVLPLPDRRLAAVVGAHPQSIVGMYLDDRGEMAIAERFRVSESETVRSPVTIVPFGNGRVAIPLISETVIYDLEDELFSVVATDGLSSIFGVVASQPVDHVIYHTADGAAAALFHEGRASTVVWRWSGVRVGGVETGDAPPLFVVADGELLIALRVVV